MNSSTGQWVKCFVTWVGTTARKETGHRAEFSFLWNDGPKKGPVVAEFSSLLTLDCLYLKCPDGIFAEVKEAKPRESKRPARRGRDFSYPHDYGGVSFPVGASLDWTVSSFA